MTKSFVSIKIITVIITDRYFMQTRYSKQREEIYSVLKSTKSHPTAEWIYEEVRKTDPTISLGTVYRNLALLCSTGQAIAIDTADKRTHYDATVKDHIHFACTKCGRVSDIEGEISLPCDLKNSGYVVERTSLVYYGLCPTCNK